MCRHKHHGPVAVFARTVPPTVRFVFGLLVCTFRQRHHPKRTKKWQLSANVTLCRVNLCWKLSTNDGISNAASQGSDFVTNSWRYSICVSPPQYVSPPHDDSIYVWYCIYMSRPRHGLMRCSCICVDRWGIWSAYLEYQHALLTRYLEWVGYVRCEGGDTKTHHSSFHASVYGCILEECAHGTLHYYTLHHT